MTLKEKLQKITSQQPSGWHEKAAYRRANRGWMKKSAWVAVNVLQQLRSLEMTQRELAEKMGISAQQVSKIVKGQENLTLETIDKLEKALGMTLIGEAGYRPAITVLEFATVPVQQKMYGGIMHGIFNKKNIIRWTVPISNTMTNESVYNQKELHTSFPGPKKNWFQIHATQS
ncbi:MAG: helix-turn-helix domain-containing protein [Flavisolibacter sp.]